MEIDPADLTPEERREMREDARQRLLYGSALADLTDRFFWNEAAQRYIDAKGRFVREDVVRAAIDEGLEAAAAQAARDFEAMRSGRLTISEWERRLMRHAKNAHLTNAALASGGMDNLTPRAQQIVQEELEDQYERLGNFARQVEDGLPLDGRARQRAGGYVNRGRSTFHAVQRYEMQRNGRNQERNILGVAEHCAMCLEITDRGWVPVGSIPLIGNRTCLYNDKCRVIFRSTESPTNDPFVTIKGTPQERSPLY